MVVVMTEKNLMRQLLYTNLLLLRFRMICDILKSRDERISYLNGGKMYQ